MPSLRLISTTARTDAVPRRWPSVRPLPRSFAQRPLPSIMTATWRGSRLLSRPLRSICGSLCASAIHGRRALGSNFHDLVFFAFQHLVDLVDEFLGDLFHPLLAVFMDVFGNLFLLLGVLHLFQRGVAVVAHRYPKFLGDFFHVLDEFLPPLLCERRDRNADDLAIVVRRQAEV